VLVVDRWILARLRHRRFYSLAELNAAISELLRQLNEERPIRRLGGRAGCPSRSGNAVDRQIMAISFEVLDHADVRVEFALNDKALIIQTDPLSANRITLVAADRH
jgi:hypothetical protein